MDHERDGLLARGSRLTFPEQAPVVFRVSYAGSILSCAGPLTVAGPRRFYTGLPYNGPFVYVTGNILPMSRIAICFALQFPKISRAPTH